MNWAQNGPYTWSTKTSKHQPSQHKARSFNAPLKSRLALSSLVQSQPSSCIRCTLPLRQRDFVPKWNGVFHGSRRASSLVSETTHFTIIPYLQPITNIDLVIQHRHEPEFSNFNTFSSNFSIFFKWFMS